MWALSVIFLIHYAFNLIAVSFEYLRALQGCIWLSAEWQDNFVPIGSQIIIQVGSSSCNNKHGL